MPYGIRLRRRERRWWWSSSSSPPPSSPPAKAENKTNYGSISNGLGAETGKTTTTTTTTTMAAAEKRPIEPGILVGARAVATTSVGCRDAKLPPRFSAATCYASMTEDLAANMAEGAQNARLDDAGQLGFAADVSRQKNYVPLTEGLAADEAEGAQNARLNDAGRS